MAKQVKVQIFRTLAALAVIFQCFTQEAQAQDLSHESPLDLTFYNTSDGQVHTLSEFLGKKTVLHFWATWCTPCVKEIPAFAAFVRENKDLNFVAISEDPMEQGALPYQRIKDFLTQKKATDLTTYWEKDGALLKAFRIGSLPATVILDKNGKQINSFEARFSWGDKAKVKRLLKSGT